MSRTEANKILERVKQGATLPLQTVNEALAATGDIAPRLPDAPEAKPRIIFNLT
jgi:hypothetical protein